MSCAEGSSTDFNETPPADPPWENGGGGSTIGMGGKGGDGGNILVGAGGMISTGTGSMSQCTIDGQTEVCYVGDSAQAGIGACTNGTRTCELSGEFLAWSACVGSGSPSAESCDGVDNDCNGVTDDGCCIPSLEVCDGIDNDCNGFADDGANCGAISCWGPSGPCEELPIPPKIQLNSSCTQKFTIAGDIACSIPNPGTQFYVNAATGSDLNDGTSPGTPWRTLCHAISAASEGGTVNVAEGDYASSAVYVGKELVIKAGYDATFTDWNPDLHRAYFYGRLTLDHNAALWGGFHIVGNPTPSDSWSHMQHRIAAGTLIRNDIEILVTDGVEQSVNLYGIVASSCSGGFTAIRCNDIYVKNNTSGAFVSDAIEFGNIALHQGKSFVDSNRICLDKNPNSGFATAVIAGYGTCGPALAPASVIITNNIIENANTGGGDGVNFYGCGGPDMDLVLTNNTILVNGTGIAGYEGPPSVLNWRLTNNIVSSLQGGSNAIDVGMGAVKILSAEGNLTFGFASNSISPAPLVSANNDLGGAANASTVFVNALGGNFKPKPGGLAIGTGINVLNQAQYGSVGSDLAQVPRPVAGPWTRGAYEP
jgi:hypothetical protein